MIGRGGFTALSLAAALTLSACGGASSGGQSTPTAPTPQASTAANAGPQRVRQSIDFPAKFEARVDRRCKQAEDEVNAIDHKGGDPSERLREIRDVFEGLATDFEQAKAPARNRRAWRRYKAIFREGADWVGRIESEVADGDVGAFNRLQSTVNRLDRRAKGLSVRYGFAECADD
jgi:hypothetical protein